MTPEQIHTLKKQQDASQQAVAAPVKTPPRPVSSTLNIDLSPGNTPPIIRLAAGFVCSLVFSDATGQPWPIIDYSLGNPGNFNIQWDNKTNTLFVQSTQAYATGNLAIRLSELNTPIMLSLVSGQREVDYRVDLQVRGRGPNALQDIYEQDILFSHDNRLLNVLDGIPPENALQLDMPQQHGQAWLIGNKIIFRTKLKLLSPAWSANISSLDGTNVYELMQTPLILATQNGKTVKIKLQGL